MADYFTRFSLVISLPTEAAQKYALDLAQQSGSAQQGDELPKDFPKKLQDWIEDWHFETDPETSPETFDVWLHSDHGGIDAACTFIQHLLQKFAPQEQVTFEWSHDCSKPRTDAFGGGAAIITAKKIKTMSTGSWIQRQAR